MEQSDYLQVMTGPAPKPREEPTLRYRDRRRSEDVSDVLADLNDSINELIYAIHELRDYLMMDRWHRQYSDAKTVRPTTPVGQRPMDPDLGR